MLDNWIAIGPDNGVIYSIEQETFCVFRAQLLDDHACRGGRLSQPCQGRVRAPLVLGGVCGMPNRLSPLRRAERRP